MKTITTLLLSIFALTSSSQIIPNSNFEVWTQFIWTLEPDGWETDNQEVFASVTQDLDAYEGDYAMKVAALQTGIGGFGEARTTFPVESIPNSLNFYVKTACSFGSVSVTARFFNTDDNEVYSATWSTNDSIANWTPISLELVPSQLVVTHARIEVRSDVGDLLPGLAEISVDAMGFDGSLSSSSEDLDKGFLVYPNPAMDVVRVRHLLYEIDQIAIYDLSGKIVVQKRNLVPSNAIEVSDLPVGMYHVEAVFKSGLSTSQKLLVNR